MTILYVLNSTDPLGGATKSFIALLKGITLAGAKAIVVVPDANGIYKTLRDMNVEVIIQKEKGNTWTGAKTLKQTFLYIPRQIGRLLINLHAQHSLEKKLEGIDFNIVHSNVSIVSLGKSIAEKRRLPHIYHIREYGDKDFGLTYFPTNASFHHYLTGKNVYSICIDNIGMTTLRVGGGDFFLYAGRIEPTKGLLKLVKAYRQYVVKTPDALPLKVAGEVIDLSYLHAITDYIVQYQLEKHIMFLGRISDMPTLYRQAKAIIIPSEHEGFGRCMPEAMSYGCITIAHNTGGSKEQLDNGLALTGKEIGFRYNDTEELTEQLITLHNLKSNEMTDMRQRAYQCVCELYSCKTYVESVLDFYHYITNKE